MASKKKSSKPTNLIRNNNLKFSTEAGKDELIVNNRLGEPVFRVLRLAMTEPTLDIDLLRTADAPRDGKPMMLFAPMDVRRAQYELKEKNKTSFASIIRDAAADQQSSDGTDDFPSRRL